MSQWRLLALILFTLSIAASVVMMWPIFGSPQLIVVGAASLLVGIGIAVLAWWRRWSAITIVLFSVVAYIALAPPLAAPDRLMGLLPTFDALRVALPATWTAWRDILTLTTPVGTTDGMLVAPLILVLVGSVSGASLILRTERAEFAGIVPACIALWAILWGPRTEWYPAVFGLLVLSGIVGIVTVVRQARRRKAAPRTLSSLGRRSIAGASVALAAVLVGIGGGTVPLGERFVLREDTPSSIDITAVDSPLAAFRGFLAPSVRDEAMFTITGVPEGVPITLAVLDSFDGEVATLSGASFQRMTEVPASGDRLGITVQGLTGAWVPHVGSVRAVSFIGQDSPDLQENIYRDTGTGALIDLVGLEAGDAIDVTFVANPSTPDLATLTPAGTSQLDVDPPENAVARLATWTADATTPGTRLQALVDGLHSDGYVSHGIDEDEPPSRAGHSLARIQALFDGVMIGDGEQYAVAAALLAEQLGFPARIVVGFQPQPAESGIVTVRGGDIAAWIEVSTAQAGWVPIQVTPPIRPIPEEDDVAPDPVGQPAQPLPPVQEEGGQEPENVPVPPVQPENVQQSTTINWVVVQWIAAGLGAVLILVAPALSVIAAKALRRRRRRRNESTSRQLDGAWLEFVDAAVDRGRDSQGFRTRLEYASNAEERAFARHVDSALFGAQELSEDDVDAAWQHGSEVVATLDDEGSGWRRWRAQLSPRSLTRRSS